MGKNQNKNKDKSKSLLKNKNIKEFKGLLKDPPSIGKRKKKHLGLKIAPFVVLSALFGFVLINHFKAVSLNNDPPPRDPHTSEQVFDPNGNEFEFGDDGQIVVDKIEEKEKQVLAQTFGSLISEDAQSRYPNEIGEIKNILSISLMPYNLNDKNNEFDKYYLSILFSDEKNTYCLNYLTGTSFKSDAELSKDFFSDFINYLSFDCAIDSCYVMSEDAKALKTLFDEKVIYVGDAYLGYKESGDEFYFIPIYKNDCQTYTYSTWSSPIDTYNKDPMKVLYEQLTDDSQDKVFDIDKSIQDADIEKVFKILQKLDFASQTSAEEKKGDIEDSQEREQ